VHLEQVNRGGGFLHAFLAQNCKRAPPSELRAHRSDDVEQQSVTQLTREQLTHVLLSARIGEAKWAAVAALGLMHHQLHPPTSS
jgi:hypothetical protein